MTTAALGLEFGKTEPNSLAVVLEPIRARTYFVNEDDKVRAEIEHDRTLWKERTRGEYDNGERPGERRRSDGDERKRAKGTV